MSGPHNIFLTGGTGFLGSRILARLAKRPDTAIYALCRKGSESKMNRILADKPELNGKIRLVRGDVTLNGLGIEPAITEELQGNGVEIFHCAAAYDLAVNKERARRVNTHGTKNVLDFALSLSSTRRFHHISTIIVSGDRTGDIYENELDRGQGFKNYYEASKFHAEKEVVRCSDRIPVTVYRPAVIVGDSRDGSADKFDGPYFALGLMMRGLPMLIPGSGDVPLHLAPVDFVADAIAEISSHEHTVGKTFHVCDPHPASVKEFVERAKELLRVRTPIVHVPISIMRFIAAMPLFSSVTRMPAQLIPYMYMRTQYDTTNTSEILHRSGIECPPIETCLEKLVRFFTLHSGLPAKEHAKYPVHG